ncbi:hypothetical protein E6O75_ATG04464 [Venturia nashicola]|uniref:Asteroid domain-containing protein n=1 Tax=Venturia nashicola TaxID=86259 RepID=A0A4Z1PD71_9PEZI|nr:hypothetical protein E6O75_ATG04464 [Venturia nashicola]
MGIPKLVSMLQPWATRYQLSNTNDVRENSIFLRHREETRGDNRGAAPALGPMAREAIIDGPALSYHAYGIAVASRNNASNALDAVPSYKEVNAILLDCLTVLECHGFRIAAIFFDGVLPSSKEPTRFERLNSSRKQLDNFRGKTPSLIAGPGKSRRFTSRLPFSFLGAQDKLKALPALPFLVPAAIETLIDSRFHFQTRVVPAEADVYCAKYASLHGGTIFTSDSDLLVYDMTEATNIVLFKDIELIGGTTVQKSTLSISTFSPTTIADRLELKSLQAFAYCVKRDHYKGTAGCIALGKRLEAHEDLLAQAALSPHETSTYESFRAFLKEYDLTSIDLSPPTSRLGKVLYTLDPRISEWIYLALPSHILNPATISHEGTKIKTIDFADKVLDMYLPFSIDDPIRATSWNLSIPIRQIAYSILGPGKHTTNEWTRRGQRIGEKKVEHLTVEEVVNRLLIWMNILSSLRAEIDDQVTLWRFMGLYSICSELIDQERPLPRREVLFKLIKGGSGGKDWALVHLEAQMEAVVFSWRMMRQCCQVQQALRKEETLTSDLDRAVDSISYILSSMPAIAVLFDPTLLPEKAVEVAMEHLFGVLGVEEAGAKPEEQEDEDGFKAANKRRKKRMKEELKSKLPPTKAAKVPKAANLFDVLGVDR